MGIESSNNDMITELLTRLPTKSLLRFEVVSKDWCNIISDNSFQRLHSQRTKPTFSGLFFGDLFDFHHHVKYLSVSRNQSLVHHNVLDFLPEKVKLIASSNGLLCCNSCYGKEVHEGTRDMFVYVCNPATKKYVQIGWPGSNCNVYYFAFAYDLEDVGNFKLIAVQTLDTLCYLFQVYSSKTKEWKKLDVCDFKYYYRNHGGMLSGDVVFASGVVYWMTSGDVILAFDVEKEQSSLIISPVGRRIHHSQGLCEACIGESEGQLHIIHISDAGLRVWLLNHKTNWVLKHSIPLSAMEKYPESIFNEAKRVACLGHDKKVCIPSWIEPISYKDGNLLLKLRCSFSYDDKNRRSVTCTKIYMYKLDTGMVEELCTLDKLGFDIGFLTTIPYSMSLVPLGSA